MDRVTKLSRIFALRLDGAERSLRAELDGLALDTARAIHHVSNQGLDEPIDFGARGTRIAILSAKVDLFRDVIAELNAKEE